MKEKRLLYAIGCVKDVYVEEMNQPAAKTERLPKSKIWLIAAIIALMLFLMGCALVCLRLQDMSIGKETYTQYFDEQGKYIDPAEKERDILTLTGYANSPTQKAFKEWYEFQQSYDPNGELLTNEPNLPDIPDAEEAVYGCYTPEMVAKLHEIADKYDLQLLDVYTIIQKYQSSIGLKALGVDSLLKPDAPAQMGAVTGLLYSPYNFIMTYDVTLTGTETYLVSEYYHRNGYFPRNAVGYYDLSEYRQWDYTTQDGTKLLLVLSSKGYAEIIADLGHGFLSISFNSYDGSSLYPQPGEIITKEGLEQVAEIFEYNLPFQAIDAAAIQPELDAAEATYQSQQTSFKTYPDYDTYMERAGIWMGPEGYEYCFFDWDGDGAEELWLGKEGAVSRCITIENGQTTETMYVDPYLCEGGVCHDVFRIEFSSYELHKYYDAQGCVLTLAHHLGNWYHIAESMDLPNLVKQPTITESEAKALMNQYPHLELPWQSVMDYAFADGRTVADLIAEQEPAPHLEGAALREAYINKLRGFKWCSHYAFYDIDGDGVEECLVGDAPDTFLVVYAYANGTIKELEIFADAVRLCENGVIQAWSIGGLEEGVEIDAYHFFRLSGADVQLVDYAFYNKATASWQSDLDGTPMPNAEAVMAKYRTIDIELRPISEYVGG